MPIVGEKYLTLGATDNPRGRIVVIETSTFCVAVKNHQVLMNSTWDIYANDFANLVRNEKDTQPSVPVGYKEYQSYYEGKHVVDKVINDLSWHPLWTGIAMATYTRHAKAERLTGPTSQDEVYQSPQTISPRRFSPRSKFLN